MHATTARLRVKRVDENAVVNSKSFVNGKRSSSTQHLRRPDAKRAVLQNVVDANTANRAASLAMAKPRTIPIYHDTYDEEDEDEEEKEEEEEEDTHIPNSDDTIEQDSSMEDDDFMPESEDDTEDEVHFIASSATAEAAAIAASRSPSITNPDALYPVFDAQSRATLHKLEKEFVDKPGIYDEDDEDTMDISMVAEYSDEIFAYMRKIELTMQPDSSYMDRQNDIHWSTRAILVDWIVQVHSRFSLLPETLYLTINYMDRFLSLKVVSLTKLQLVGSVALFLAAKYEEINCPSVQDIAYMVENTYSTDEILQAEHYMITLLDFKLAWPGPMSFLRRTSKADDYDYETRTLAKYLLEISIIDQRFVGSPPSWLAASAHCLARRMLNRGGWTDDHAYFGGYTEQQLEPAIAILLASCKNPKEHHKSIYDKYADRRFKRASLFVADYMKSVV